jgi:hypothetical protein
LRLARYLTTFAFSVFSTFFSVFSV